MLAPQSHRAVAQTDLLLICLHIMLAFKIVHCRGTDRTPHYVALINHREIIANVLGVYARFVSVRSLEIPDRQLRAND
jgi:hypothetical protein